MRCLGLGNWREQTSIDLARAHACGKRRLYAKNIDRRERVFFFRPQALEASSKNALGYDEHASGRLNYFIHADHIDTPRVVVDRGNNIRWRWMAEPFGTTAA